MLYTIASAAWFPGLPLTPRDTRSGLFRTREAATRSAAGRPILAVALCHDATRGVVVAQPPAVRELGGGWSAPAIVTDSGAITVLAAIPAILVREVGRPEIRIHSGEADPRPSPLHAGLRAPSPPPSRRDSIAFKRGASR